MIQVFCSGFTGTRADLNGRRDMLVSWPALYWAAISVGKTGWVETCRGGFPRLCEVVSLCSAVRAYLERVPWGLRVTQLYRELERSEKATVSYRIGMTLAKLATHRILGVPHLVHLDTLVRNGRASLQQGSLKRGDLAGPDMAGEWHVVEAKGRANRPEATLAGQAKEQAKRIVRIDGRAPVTKCSSVSNLSEAPIAVGYEDPSGASSMEPLVVRVSGEAFYSRYYEIINDLREAGSVFRAAMFMTPEGLAEYMVTELPGVDLVFGAERRLYDIVAAGQSASLQPYLATVGRTYRAYELASVQRGSAYLAADGLAVAETGSGYMGIAGACAGDPCCNKSEEASLGA